MSRVQAVIIAMSLTVAVTGSCAAINVLHFVKLAVQCHASVQCSWM
jgi:hypothetical protein